MKIKCVRTSRKIASLAAKQMRTGERNQRRVAASALRTRVKPSRKRDYGKR